MVFLELAKNRYSEQYFDQRPIEQEKLDKILEAGRVVPTACNYQPQHFYLIRSEDGLRKPKTVTHFHYNVTLMILVCCTHNKCKFCTMYRDVPFKMQPMEWIEQDLQEIASIAPDARTIQLLSANPLALTYDKLAPILEMINRYLPKMEYIYAATRVTDIRNKTVEQLKSLKEMGLREISLGIESGDDRTLERINKGYTSADIPEQCHKLEEAGIDYWMTFLNGVAGREHSHDHAVNSAKIFSLCKPMVVGTGGLTLFPGTPLLEEVQRGEFIPLSEKEMLIELKTFAENLTSDCSFITHHTVSGKNLTDPDFLKRKESIIAALEHEISHGDMDAMAAIRNRKRTL